MPRYEYSNGATEVYSNVESVELVKNYVRPVEAAANNMDQSLATSYRFGLNDTPYR